jgi:4'-phosphopantetheinyl transferase
VTTLAGASPWTGSCEPRTRPRAAARAQPCAYFADARAIRAEDVDALVTDDDRAGLDARALARRRTQYLAGRALLRFALERETRGPARSHRLTTRPGGKLDCAGGPGISLSHSGRWVACAIASEGDVGIDVEVPDSRRRTHDIASAHFARAERDWLATAPRYAFYWLWVLKEAYLKCVGRGLAGGLELPECIVDPPVIEARAPLPAHLALYGMGDAFAAIVTTSRAAPAVRLERWSPSGRRGDVCPPRLIAATL